MKRAGPINRGCYRHLQILDALEVSIRRRLQPLARLISSGGFPQRSHSRCDPSPRSQAGGRSLILAAGRINRQPCVVMRNLCRL